MNNHDKSAVSLDRKKWIKRQDALQEKVNELQAAWMEKDPVKISNTISGCASELMQLAREMGIQEDLLEKCIRESLRHKKTTRLLKLARLYRRNRT